MQAARAARAVDGIIHRHLQDWDHDGSRFVWEEDGLGFTLATFYTRDEATKLDTTHLTIQCDGSSPVEFTGEFGCTTSKLEDVAIWVKDLVEMFQSVQVPVMDAA